MAFNPSLKNRLNLSSLNLKDMDTAEEVRSAQVLVVGRRDYIIDNVKKILLPKGFDVQGAMSDDDVLERLKTKTVDVLFIGGSVEPNSKRDFAEWIHNFCPNTKMIEHFGGPATILLEVQQALTQKGG